MNLDKDLGDIILDVGKWVVGGLTFIVTTAVGWIMNRLKRNEETVEKLLRAVELDRERQTSKNEQFDKLTHKMGETLDNVALNVVELQKQVAVISDREKRKHHDE